VAESSEPVRVGSVDDLDRRIVSVMRERPRIPVIEVARVLGVARGTVQARLARMERSGVIGGHGPEVDSRALGYVVMAFTTLEIRQGADAGVVDHLSGIPEVLSADAVTGPGDVLCRIVARSNDDLHRVIRSILESHDVIRTVTVLSMGSLLRRTEADLMAPRDA